MGGETKTHKVLKRFWDFRLRVYAEGIMTGFIVGNVIVLFRIVLEKAELLRGQVYIRLQGHGGWSVAVWFAVLVLIAFLLGKIVQKEPMTGGSGIPQVEGILSGRLKMDWLRVAAGKFVGGILAIGAGLSLGREGPSIQLGAAVAQGFSRARGRLKVEERFLITSGASAGLAAAFNAPLAGVMFALEELHKNFSSVVLTTAMAASLTADVVSQRFFGQRPIFNFRDLPVLPLRYYFYLVLLGLIIGAFGVLFNRSLVGTLNIYEKIPWLPRNLRPAIPLIIGGILGFFRPEALGGGHSLIESISRGNIGLTMLFVLIIIKFLFTMISYGSGVPGGIFLPLLVIGALAGDLYGGLLVSYLHVNAVYANNFVILAMAAYFTAIVKAPVTGSILITEMTGSFEHLLPLIMVSMTAYLVTDVLKSKPIYDELLGRILKNKDNLNFTGDSAKKIILEIPVCLGSQIAGRRIKSVTWPDNCLLVGIKRGQEEIIPRGNTMIYPGDYLIVLTNEDQAAQIRKSLVGMAGDCIL